MKEFQKGVLDNNRVISTENVQRMGEIIALCAIKTVIVRGGKDLNNLYKGLLRDINRFDNDMSRYSDGYEIAQEALDEEELETLKERAAAFGLDKADSFEEYKGKYLQSVHEITGNAEYNIDNIAGGSDNSVFDSIVSKQSGMTTSYKDALNQKFVQGLGEAKKAFNKFVSSNSVADAAFTGTAHFDPASRSVNMNFAADLQNMRGAGTTFFHEHGHYIDFMAAGTSNASYLSTDSKVFGSLLRPDFRDYVNAYKKKHNMKTADAYIAISFELRGHEKHSLSDLLDGISRGKCSGMYGHRRSYWSYQGALETEAFAHMFEAMFDSGKYALMKQYFPNALAEFERMLKGVI